MERVIEYPVLEGKIAERGIMKRVIARTLGITPNALGNKLSGRTEFTWSEVLTMKRVFFKDEDIETLMQRRRT